MNGNNALIALPADSIITVPFPLKLHASTPTLLRLATISSSCLLLVSRHTSTELYINSWRSREAEGFGDLYKIELVDIKYRT